MKLSITSCNFGTALSSQGSLRLAFHCTTLAGNGTVSVIPVAPLLLLMLELAYWAQRLGRRKLHLPKTTATSTDTGTARRLHDSIPQGLISNGREGINASSFTPTLMPEPDTSLTRK